MLSVLNCGVVGQIFFYTGSSEFLNLFTCAGDAKMLIQPLLEV